MRTLVDEWNRGTSRKRQRTTQTETVDGWWLTFRTKLRHTIPYPCLRSAIAIYTISNQPCRHLSRGPRPSSALYYVRAGHQNRPVRTRASRIDTGLWCFTTKAEAAWRLGNVVEFSVWSRGPSQASSSSSGKDVQNLERHHCIMEKTDRSADNRLKCSSEVGCKLAFKRAKTPPPSSPALAAVRSAN
jgi:hypothetical protein